MQCRSETDDQILGTWRNAPQGSQGLACNSFFDVSQNFDSSDTQVRTCTQTQTCFVSMKSIHFHTLSIS